MEEYSIKIFPLAQCDLLEIVDYLNELSPQAAIKYYDLIIEKIYSLRSMPQRCPLARQAHLRVRGFRILIIKKYIIFYIIKDKIVEIRRILYAKRQYDH